MVTRLEMLIEKFNGWRKEGNSQRVPTALRKEAIELSERYPLQEMASHLGLKKETMKQWQRRAKAAGKSALNGAVNFIPLSACKPDNLKKTENLTLTVELSPAVKLFLSGQSLAEVVELAANLAKRLSA